MSLLKKIIEFEWDEGNDTKNWIKHNVRKSECEQVFFNKPILISPDIRHSDVEKRYQVLGRTKKGRKLFISFTVRKTQTKMRVISARDQSRKEKKIYEKI